MDAKPINPYATPLLRYEELALTVDCPLIDSDGKPCAKKDKPCPNGGHYPHGLRIEAAVRDLERQLQAAEAKRDDYKEKLDHAINVNYDLAVRLAASHERERALQRSLIMVRDYKGISYGTEWDGPSTYQTNVALGALLVAASVVEDKEPSAEAAKENDGLYR